MRSVLTVIIAALLLCSNGICAADKPLDTEPSQGPIGSGVEVHGRWIIEVLDTDGTTVSLTEFNNDLFSTVPISHMMGLNGSDYGSYGGWCVRLYNNTQQPCGVNGCAIFQNAFDCGSVFDLDSTNLTVTVIETTPDFHTIRLNGSVIIQNTTTIAKVYTHTKICSDSVLPSNCLTSNSNCNFYTFTSADVPSPPAVQAGQMVVVTVEISFS